ncbi:MAG: flavin reductase family protein [Tannerellaceae bacterium]|nr:flavin reductase family protein [Tannerellaceae bacterium]
MKKYWLLFVGMILLTHCNSSANESTESSTGSEKTVEVRTETTQDVRDKTFEQLFKAVPAEGVMDETYAYAGRTFTVITSGTSSDYNSMIAGWGGPGTLFGKPSTWCFLRANRYTLEYIRKEKTYTMAYFPQQYNEQVLFLGSKTGRDTDKMKESTLTPVETPSGMMSYKEAEVIIECTLTEITSVTSDDFYTQEGKDFVLEGYEDAGDYHKMVFGEITRVWVKK